MHGVHKGGRGYITSFKSRDFSTRTSFIVTRNLCWAFRYRRDIGGTGGRLYRCFLDLLKLSGTVESILNGGNEEAGMELSICGIFTIDYINDVG